MSTNTLSISRRRRRQRGSETIEAGLICTIMFALIFLLLDISLSLFIKVTLQEAARDGVRYGVTEQLLAGDSYLSDSIAKVVKSNSGGFITNAGCQVTVTYYDPYGGVTTTPTAGSVLHVAIQGYQYTPLGAIFKSGAPVSINVQASDIMEACPGGGCPTAVNPTPPTCP
ncbi:MAG TPA: TadE/TadG family type IV pilus assembly protein [Bryobacteraceae bacterium]|nr:TadE/TadG family type IV pilus assembly protein [Bryobacteraceae bacterium]